ncbi:hypothetical protein HS041_05905 [Planomonospora sp. ID67723]|uniref:hypothetical protein n=1 Tax=Planomonospora sp. ID67723 TaxID=2738134 RepID=UPI0018C3817B|nr:hypothetical protein [Planomonospora sp. ID67723]MBG0827294.1 hypothetical protein [Planomonospora sp. ID67723]
MSSHNYRDDRHRPLGDAGSLQRPTLLVRLWRWRTEIVLTAVVTAVTVLVAAAALREGGWWPFLALTSTVSASAATRSGRRRARAHFGFPASRHRIRRVRAETPARTRTGQDPPDGPHLPRPA